MFHLPRAALIVAMLAIAPATRESIRPLDALHAALDAYIDPHDELAFAMKAKSIASNPYKFWRGTKDLYFTWCKSNAADWLADKDAYVATHGDLHFGNIGTYATDRGFGDVAFGLVDFDDSAVLPFQLELLQGAITLRLVAAQSKLELPDEALAAMLDGYRTGVSSEGAAPLDSSVQKLIDGASRVSYGVELKRFTENGRFRSSVRSEKGKLTDILRVAPGEIDAIADSLAGAVSHSDRAKSVFRLRDASDFRAAIRDIALRTRIGSAGSQGQKKYVVLLRGALKDDDGGDSIIYLKQQIPSAAERSGAIPRDARPAAERCADLTARLTSPQPYLNAWCRIKDESFVVQLKEPWSNELDVSHVKTPAELVRLARTWGFAAGRAHRNAGLKPAIVESRMGDDLYRTLTGRSNNYTNSLLQDFENFRTDPRVTGLVAAADRAITQLESSR